MKPTKQEQDFTQTYQGHETFMPYVLNRTTGAVNADFQVLLREHGMTLLHWRVLAFLRETDGLGISALANAAGVDQATLSRALTVMEKAGYVRREPSATDQRVLEIHLLSAGERQFHKVLPPAWAIYERSVKGLTIEEQHEFQRLLKKIWGNFA
ncbi:MarR family winged helix-turn-helix transcriptional regulator [Neopusillimonas maritima]|nr:MarR family transcriptional regulator [Neopusillimonas maritima]